MGPPTQVVYLPLADDARVYRAYPFSDSLNKKTGRPEPRLFYRKATETALSVGLSKQAITDLYPTSVGMCELIIASVRDCPDALDVIQDGDRHGSITGVPLRTEDQLKAIRIAKYLVRIAHHCPEGYTG
jgi:hypothetical protein